MAKSKGQREVVVQLRWIAVVKVTRPMPFFTDPEQLIISYDIMEWNLFRMRWGRMSQANNFGTLENAERCAKLRDDQINTMIENNRNLPPRITV
jgi:hypothetical protein